MADRLRPPGFGAQTHRPYGLGDGARLFRRHATFADAQRRYNAAAGDNEKLNDTPLPNPPPQGGREQVVPCGEEKDLPQAAAGREQTADERRRAAGWMGRPPGEVELSLLTHQARALYEARVVPVGALARLCGVSLRTLYHHVHKQGWRRRRSSVPRDLAKSERQKRRYRERKAKEQASPRGLKARDPAGHARALAAAERAGLLSGEALSRAIARHDMEAYGRTLAHLTQALRALAAADKAAQPPRVRGKDRVKRKRRRYQWRPMLPGQY